MASKRGNSNMVKLLLDRGSKIDAKTKVRHDSSRKSWRHWGWMMWSFWRSWSVKCKVFGGKISIKVLKSVSFSAASSEFDYFHAVWSLDVIVSVLLEWKSLFHSFSNLLIMGQHYYSSVKMESTFFTHFALSIQEYYTPQVTIYIHLP